MNASMRSTFGKLFASMCDRIVIEVAVTSVPRSHQEFTGKPQKCVYASYSNTTVMKLSVHAYRSVGSHR